MTGFIAFSLACGAAIACGRWLHGRLTTLEQRHQDDAHEATWLALAEAVGVVPEPDPVKVAATREALRIEALATAEARRDLTDERLAAWLAGAE